MKDKEPLSPQAKTHVTKRKQWLRPTATVHSLADAQNGSTNASQDSLSNFS